jgi:antitoxin ParD1/3/4
MARQTTLNVSLTPVLERYVRSRVSSGRYESASEVIRDGLRALQDRDQATESFWADVREKVADARRQVSEGKTVDGDHAMDQILAELKKRTPAARRRKPHSR